MMSLAPIIGIGGSGYKTFNIQEETFNLFDQRHLLADVDPRKGKYLSAFLLFRGRGSKTEIEDAVLNAEMID